MTEKRTTQGGDGILSSLDAHRPVARKLVELIGSGAVTPCYKYPDQEIDLIREWNALCGASPEDIPLSGRGASGFSHLITALAFDIGRKAMDIVAEMRDAGVDLDTEHAVEKLHQEVDEILESGNLGHDDIFPMKTRRWTRKKQPDHISVRFENWRPTAYEKAGKFSWKPLEETDASTPDTPQEIRP